MPDYLLFAARDGETLFQRGTCHDQDEARAWAGRQIVAWFTLKPEDCSDFDRLQAECDGVVLLEDGK